MIGRLADGNLGFHSEEKRARFIHDPGTRLHGTEEQGKRNIESSWYLVQGTGTVYATGTSYFGPTHSLVTLTFRTLPANHFTPIASKWPFDLSDFDLILDAPAFFNAESQTAPTINFAPPQHRF